MRLANGIVVDQEGTFGVLKFSAYRRDSFVQNEDGTASDEVKGHVYDLKSKAQGGMIQVTIPSEVALKEFEYNAEVEIVNPVVNTISSATFMGADVKWYIKADDIVLKNKSAAGTNNNNAAGTNVNANAGQNHKDKDLKNNNKA